jgi:hypothetical protein
LLAVVRSSFHLLPCYSIMPTQIPNPTGPSGTNKKPGSTIAPGKSFALPPKSNNKLDKKTKSIKTFFSPTYPLSTLQWDDPPSPSPQPSTPAPVPRRGNPPGQTDSIPEETADEEMNDEATVVTGRSGGSQAPSPTPPSPTRVITLKYNMQSNNKLSNQHVAICTLQLLNAIASVDPESPCAILDQHGRQMANLSKDITSKFEDYIPIHHFQPTSEHNKPYSLWTIFQVSTDLPLRAIRNHPAVSRVLTSTKGRLTQYPWTIQEPDTVSVCFAVGAIPQYQSQESFEAAITTRINQKCPNMRIPKFKCILSRISATLPGQTSVSCQAFDIQTRRNDLQKLADLLKIACPPDADLAVMFYPTRYSNPSDFAGAVYLQSEFQRQHRIVAITGISTEHMFPFENTLLQEFGPHLLQIFPTRATELLNPTGQPIGRWNLLCKNVHFTDLAREVYDKLPTLFAEYLQSIDQTLPEGAEPVAVKSRFFGKPTNDGDTTIASDNNSLNTFNSKWTARITHEVKFVMPPATHTPYPTPFPPAPGGSVNTTTSSISWAQVASRQGSTSTPNHSHPSPSLPPAQDHNMEHLLSSLQDQLSSSLQSIQDDLHQRMDRLEESFTAKTEQKQAPTDHKNNQPAPPPAPAFDPTILTQVTSMLSQLVTRLHDLETKVYSKPEINLEAVLDHKLDIHFQQLNSMFHPQPAGPSTPSPPRKRSKSAPKHRRQQIQEDITPMDLQSSFRPDDTPDEGEDQDEDNQHEPI